MVPVPRRRLLKQMGLILLATVLGVNLLLLLLATFARLVERLQQLEKWSDWLLMADVDSTRLSSASVFATDERLIAAANRQTGVPMQIDNQPLESPVMTIASSNESSVLLEALVNVAKPPAIDIIDPCRHHGRRHHHRRRLLVVVFLFSRAAGSVAWRRVIRETYGDALRRSCLAELYFVMMGQTASDDIELEEQLRTESHQHNDILQFTSQKDLLRNFHLKLATLRWAALHCSHAQFAFLLNDDAHYFIRVKPFLDVLTVLSESSINKIYEMQEAGFYLLPATRLAALYEAIVDVSLQEKTVPELPFQKVLLEKVNLTRDVLPEADQFLKTDCPNATSELAKNQQPGNFDSFNAEQTLRCLWETFGED